MIVVTGAAGFIGSCLIGKLNEEGYKDIVAVDDFSSEAKNRNLENKTLTEQVDRSSFFEWLAENEKLVQFIFHLGARTDTAEMNEDILRELNLEFSQKIWQACIQYGFPLVYASSAATYGLGEHGYDDDHSLVSRLSPLNPYGRSKNDFDKWVLNQTEHPSFWAGFKFFNVYGPNEYHKGRMASVVYHAYHQLVNDGEVKLFRSHNPHYEDGEQMRDFVYVKDVVNVLYWFMHNRQAAKSGIYNLGTGKAETFMTLAKSLFKAMDQPENIRFIDTPADIRDKYQYFTEAKMDKLRAAGYTEPFRPLEDGIKDYVQNYLEVSRYY